MKFILIVLIIAAICFSSAHAGVYTENQYNSLFTKFITKFKKKIAQSDFLQRFVNFKSNVDKISLFNKKPKRSETLAVNQFADLSIEEIESRILGDRPVKTIPRGAKVYNNPKKRSARFAESDEKPYINWVEAGKTVPVRNQGSCGSCYAFATADALSSRHAIITETDPVLASPQEMVDCSTASKCNGGNSWIAMKYAADNKGLCTEEAYKYTGLDTGACKSNCTDRLNFSGDFVYYATEDDAMEGLKNGPMYVSMYASPIEFMFYSSGVIDAEHLVTTKTNHAVVLVGTHFDKEINQQVWVIQNSWGSWGENPTNAKGYLPNKTGNGFVRIVAGKKMLGMGSRSSAFASLELKKPEKPTNIGSAAPIGL